MLKTIDPETPVKNLSMAGCFELNSLRPCFQNAHAIVNKMSMVKEKAEQIANGQVL